MENIKKGNERKKQNLRGCANLDKENHEKLVKLFELPKLSENTIAEQKKSTKQNGLQYLRKKRDALPNTRLNLNKKTSQWVMFEHVPVVYEYL